MDHRLYDYDNITTIQHPCIHISTLSVPIDRLAANRTQIGGVCIGTEQEPQINPLLYIRMPRTNVSGV